MRKIYLVAIMFSLSATVVSASADSPAQDAMLVGDAGRGGALMLQKGCYSCHGTVGQGGSAGPRIAPDPLPAEAIMSYVRHPAGQMPPYAEKVLSAQEIADIRAYLTSVPKPPASSSLPQLDTY